MAWWIFQNVVITTALAAAVAVICRTGRLGPVARHALWVLVLVKFVTPPLVVWPWVAPDPLGIATLGARAGDSQIAAVSLADQGAMPASDRDSTSVGIGLADPAPLIRDGHPSTSSGSTAWPWLFGVWAAGSLCVLVLEGVRLARLARRIRMSAVHPPDAAIVQRATALSARLGIRPVPVVMLAGSTSPAVWGVGRPVLLWPAALPGEFTDACIDGLLVHELAHVKRGDHLVGWIELAAGVVWWWNPLFWFVRSALREQAELACDAWVISALPNGRRAYAESLLALSGAAMGGAPSMAVVGIRATSRRILERRLVMIMKGRAPLRLPFVGLFCLALVGAATLPAWATGQQAPQSAQPTQPQQPAPARQSQQGQQAQPAQRHVTAQPAQQPRPAQGQQPAQQAQPVQRHQTATPALHQSTTQPTQAQPAWPTPVQPAQTTQWQTKPQPQPHIQVGRSFFLSAPQLPEDGQKLLQGFETDREAIQKEADLKMQARREAVVKELEKLQDQYAKAGKLDEALAIRDYLRAGGPGQGDWTISPVRKIVR